MGLNPENQDVPYLLGRAFRIIEATQRRALPAQDVIRRSWMDAAMTRPLTTYPTLEKKFAHYVSKLRAEMPRLANKNERLLDSTLGRIDALPRTLNVQERAEWILGYHQEAEELFQKKEAKGEAKEG